jgi:hypothetical protein
MVLCGAGFKLHDLNFITEGGLAGVPSSRVKTAQEWFCNLAGKRVTRMQQCQAYLLLSPDAWPPPLQQSVVVHHCR